MDGMRRVCSDIGFVNGVSIASLDDDLLRLRSAKVDDLGLTRTRNPAKRLQKLVSEKGAKTTKWASSKFTDLSTQGKSTTMMHALAYRGDLGKVVLCNTSVKAAGPGKWTYVSEPEPRLSSGCQFQDFEKLVVKLTQCQRTPDWLVMRKFRTTGLVAIELLRSLAKYAGISRNDENDANLEEYYDLAGHTSVQLLLKLLSIPISGESSNREPAPNQLSRTVLDKAKNKGLQQLCRARGIATSGNKREMTDRLLSPETASSLVALVSEDDDEPRQALTEIDANTASTE
ncbi:unnamed protein product [Phytophthora fragariaefolia]|uniref:Unnamed protein product n=1 Tax=Phytophthora fragariaefolia TaxID=1490495 RepID=A0A9W7CZ02_9STRA|nr:unnamed protein product [Phytophthora fragariaefolia]